VKSSDVVHEKVSQGTTFNRTRTIDRARILRIVRIREHHLADPVTWMKAGAAAGGLIGAAVGGADNAREGNNGRWLVDGFVGAAAGFFVSAIAVTGIGLVDLMQPHRKIVYENAGARGPQSRSPSTKAPATSRQ
jgi:hypothetical protein